MKTRQTIAETEDTLSGRPTLNELWSVFRATTQQAEQESLQEQIGTEAQRLLTDEIQKTLLWSSNGLDRLGLQDLEDIVSRVVLQVVRRLRKVSLDEDTEDILDLTNYVKRAARNGLSDYIRQRHPERSRFSHSLRRVISQDEFMFWTGPQGRLLCGYQIWRDTDVAPCSPYRVNQVRGNFEAHVVRFVDGGPETSDLRGLTSLILDRVGAPIEFGDMVKLLWDALAITRSEASVKETQPRGFLSEVPDQGPSVAAMFELKERLQCVWREICALPALWRAALLLNLRDSGGGDLTALFLQTHVATQAELAQALELTADDFARIWSALPMNDIAIAKQLGISERQVINFRRSARRRLRATIRRGGVDATKI